MSRRAVSVTVQALAWTVVAAISAALVVAVLVPRIAGATPDTVLTGSMRPDYPPGTLVVVRPVEFSEIKTGDVITYQLESGRSAVVTHRVVKVTITMAGEKQVLTQGDANSVADQDPVRPVQVKGRLWYSVPHLGRLNTLLTGDQRQLATYGVVGALLAYAAYMLTSALRDRRRARADRPAGTHRKEEVR